MAYRIRLSRLWLLLPLLAPGVAGCAQTPPPAGVRLELDVRSGPTYSIGISPDGRSLWIPSVGITRVWDLQTSSWSTKTIPGSFGSLSPDGRMLARVIIRPRHNAQSPEVAIVNAESGKVIHLLSGHKYYVTALAFSPDSSLLATGSRDGTLRIWSTRTGRQLRMIQIKGRYFEDAAFSPDGKTLAAACCYGFDGGDDCDYLGLFDVATGRMKRRMHNERFGMEAIAFSPDGRWIASSGWAESYGGKSSWDNRVRIWRVTDGENLRTIEAKETVKCLAASPDGARLFLAEDQGYVEAWDTRSWRQTWQSRISREHVNIVACTPDGRTLVAGTARPFKNQGYFGQVMVLDATDGSVKQEITVPDLRPAVLSLALSPDGAQVSGTYSDGLSRTWGLRDGRLVQVRRAQAGATPASAISVPWLQREGVVVDCLAISPDHQTILTGGRDEMVRLWEADSHVCRQSFRANAVGVNAIAVTPDGKTILTGGGDGTIMVWSNPALALRATLMVLPHPGASQRADEWITFTPGNYYVGSARAKDHVSLVIGDSPRLTETYRDYFNRQSEVARALAVP